MSQNFVSTDWLLTNEDWISAEKLAKSIDSLPILHLLGGKGLLTIALSELYQTPVLVECLRQSEWIDDRRNAGLRRDVVLKAAENACVSASTLMPAAVLEKFPWLTTLGDRPLGAVLEEHRVHRRGPYEFKRIDESLGFQPKTDSATFSWARRYRFFLGGGDLLVTELFSAEVFERLKDS